MDDAGYPTLSTNCARIVSARHTPSDSGASDAAAMMPNTAIDGTSWEVDETQEPTYMDRFGHCGNILYGCLQRYLPGQPLAGQIKLRALVERYVPGNFHVKTFFR